MLKINNMLTYFSQWFTLADVFWYSSNNHVISFSFSYVVLFIVDPHGNSGLYIRHPPPSMGSGPHDENYANELRNKTKSLQQAPANNIQRVR